MTRLPPRAQRLFRLAVHRRHRVESAVDDEIRFHIDARTEQLVRQGLSPDLARAEATRRFGSLRDAHDALRRSDSRRDRRVRLRERLGAITQNICIAGRSLRRSPLFVGVAVLCLTLGIGANAAIFSVIDGVLLRPLPFVQPERLVRVWPAGAVPPGIYGILKEQSRSYVGLAGFTDARKVSVNGAGAPARYDASDVTDNLFDVLGIHAAVGRTFLPGEDEQGRDRIVLLGNAMWRDRFGGDPGVVGNNITIDGVSRTIVGVMPPSFHFPGGGVQLWMPALFAAASPNFWWSTPLQLIGRLGPDFSPSRARAEAAELFPRARGAFPMRMPDGWGRDVDVVPLRESVVGSTRSTLVLLFAAVGVVLLIACVNIATLYLDRASGRERELAVRAALGAGRSRIAAQLLTECLIVATLGAVGGLVLAAAGVRLLVAMLPAGTPRVGEIAVDGRVLAFTIALALLSGLAFGMLPVLRASRLDVQSSLRADGRAGKARRQTSNGRALAVAQVALAVVIVSAAGLLLKSFWRLRQVDLGFDMNHVIAAAIPLPSFNGDTAIRAPIFYNAVLDRVRAIPGVRVAAATSAVPFGATAYPAAMDVEAHPAPPGTTPALPIRTYVSTDYFRALEIPLLRGRSFTAADRAGTPAVAIIDAASARTFWPTENAVGQRIRYVWNHDWITIIGVVGGVKRDSLSAGYPPSIYLPMEQGFGEEMAIVARTSNAISPEDLTARLRAAVASVDATVPVPDVRQLTTMVTASASRSRFSVALLVLFAAAALLLGAAGVYGVVSAAVSRRTREIGVRMALGATSDNVLRLVLRETFWVTIAGVLLGIVGAVGTGGLLRGLLFGVGAIDATVLLAVAALLTAVTLLASLAPARRAARVDPLVAIRSD